MPQPVDRGQCFQRGNVAAAGHDDVGLAAVVVAGEVPDAEADGAMANGFVHGQPLRLRLLAGDDHVDVVAAAQAMVGDREQGVGVGRQIDADHLGLLVHHMVDEARVLMAEAVVVLPPDVRGEQIVQRGDGPAPGDVAAYLEPLGVLVEHRIDDVDEGFVAGEEAVPAGEQIAFEPALAHVLAEDFHDAAVGRDVVVDGNDFGGDSRLVTSNSGAQRLESVSSGETTRKFFASAFSFMTSRRKTPMTRVDSALDDAGLRHIHGVIAEIGQHRVP